MVGDREFNLRNEQMVVGHVRLWRFQRERGQRAEVCPGCLSSARKQHYWWRQFSMTGNPSNSEKEGGSAGDGAYAGDQLRGFRAYLRPR